MRKSILLSTARSGTNFVLNVYGKMFSDDVVLGEIFRAESDSCNEMRKMLGVNQEKLLGMVRHDAAGLWRKISQICEGHAHGIICKVFYYHSPENDELWDSFREDCKVIHLIRRNSFDIYVSREIAKRTGKWRLLDGESTADQGRNTLTLNRSDLISFTDWHRASVLRARNFFEGSDYCEIFYEDICTSPTVCAATISDIYGVDVPTSSVKVELKRQKCFANSQIVENYDDVSDLDAEEF